MALSNIFTPIMKGLLLSYKTLTHQELQETAWLMSLYIAGVKEQTDLTITTEAGFQAAVELFAGNDKIDLITYKEEENKLTKLDGTYNYCVYQYCREEEEKFQIVVENRWSYHDSGYYVEEFDHDYYSIEEWKQRVLKIQELNNNTFTFEGQGPVGHLTNLCEEIDKKNK
jgi:hypothetical protein